MKTRIIVVLLFLLVASSIGVEIGATLDTVRILSVSTQVENENQNRNGSVSGGTRLFIKVVGHDTHMASNNQVFVGPYQCVIPDMGVNEIFITCVTTPASNPAYMSSLPVIVRTIERSDSQCAMTDQKFCTFTYTEDLTPIMSQIVPRATSASARLDWLGYWRVSNTNQINKMLIGDYICDRFFMGLNEDQPFSGHNYNSLKCDIGLQMEGGYYPTQFLSKPGTAQKESRVTTVRSKTLATPYDLQIVPIIDSVSHSQVTSEGAIIKIKAKGLPTDQSKVSVDFGGIPCNVLTVDALQNQVICLLPSGISTPAGTSFSSSSGVRLQKMVTTMWSIDDVIADYRLPEATRVNTFYTDKIVAGSEFLDMQNTYSRFSYVMSGFFTPPRDGTYIFQLTSSYKSRLYFQTSGSSTDASTMTNIAEIIEGTNLREPFSKRYADQTPISLGQTLLKSQSYYFELFVLAKNMDMSFANLGVQIPTGDTNNYINSAGQVTRMAVQYPFTKEVVTITHEDLSSTIIGSFEIHFIEPFGTQIRKLATYWDCPSTKFDKTSSCTQIMNHFINHLQQVRSTCVVTALLDASNQPIGATWTLTFIEHRLQITPTFTFDTNLSIAPLFTQVTQPGPDLSGAFSMLCNGIYLSIDSSTSIPFDVPDHKIVNALKTIIGTTNIKINRLGKPIDGASYYIDFFDLASPITITAESSQLIGAGVSIQIDQLQTPNGSTLIYSCIENDLLSQKSPQPAIGLRVNDVQAICSLSNNCSIVIDDTKAPSFTSFTDDENLKQVTINGLIPSVGSTGLTEADFTVVYNKEVLQSMSYNSITQTLVAQYTMKIAGSYKPIVDQVRFGNALSPSVSVVAVTPLITALSMNSIFSFGGSELVITGKYFPNTNQAGLIVTIDGIVAKITNISNTSITIITPLITSIGPKNVVVSFDSLSSPVFSINVDNTGAITISGIDQTIVSPVEKTRVTVTGTNFGTNSKVLTGYLDKLDSLFNVVEYGKYQVNVVAAFDTSVTVVLGGGQSGTYRLRIVKIGSGSNDPNTTFDRFEYNIYITSLSRTESSKYGGTKLVIFGQNFSLTPIDNQVLVIYSTINSEFCIISSVTKTEIHCTLPDMSSHFTTPTAPTQIFQIEVWGKLIALANISPQSPTLKLEITFSEALAPIVTSLSSHSLLATQQITLNGVNLPLDISTFSVIVIGYETLPATILSSTGTIVQFKVPLLPYGNGMNLVVSTVDGYSAPQTINVITDISSFTQYTGISSGGQEFDIPMAGLLPNQEPIFRFNLEKAIVLSFAPITGVVRVRLPATTAGSLKKFEYARSAFLPLNPDGSYAWQLHGTTFTVVTASWTITAKPSVSGQTVTITGTGLTNLKSAYLQKVGTPKSIQYAPSIAITSTASSATLTFGNAPAGSYKLFLLDINLGYPIFTDPTFSDVLIDLPATLTVSSPLISSFSGGFAFTITGMNFNTNELLQNEVNVCGNLATVISATSTQLNLLTPPAYTLLSLTKYGFSQQQLNQINGFTTFGDDPAGTSAAVGDGDLLFYYQSSNAVSCYVGLQFDSATLVMLSRFELFPRSWGVTNASAFFGTTFQASLDKITWVDILQIGTDFHLGKNLYIISSLLSTGSNANISNPYRYFRLYDSTGVSKCELVEIILYGWKTSTAVENAGTLTCPISISVNGSTTKSLTDSVSYQNLLSYIVQSVLPNYGDINGGTSVTVTLDRIPTGTVDVLIDGQACLNVAVSGLTVTCTTAKKSTTSSSSFVVKVQGQQAINNGILFYYGHLWSQEATWGGDFAPINGDLVSVLANNVLIVDVQYVGVLNTVVIDQGTLIFANNMDIHFEAQNIIVRHGTVIIGTQSAPIQNQVRITMHGLISDKQFPTIGNKGLSIHNGSLDIQGKERVVTWTELSVTAEKNANSIQVFLKDVLGFDWAVGEEIVISSTDFSHGHSERRIIKTITKSATTATITFEQPLTSRHVSLSETYNGKTIAMRAEVGLLSRNVIFEGNQESIKDRYGAHIMLHGASTSARIRHAEFRYTGQPKIIGRYPIHFHMVGDVSGSIVEGNAVHDSFARVLTIHATHYLRVKNNVGFNCAGHNIFLEDGIETNNIIENNLIISTKQVWSMLQSDITAASYWITNPLNTVINNRAGGGDFYGFWYEIKPNPDGPSARSDICPQGMALGKFDGNMAHSYDRFGLRIFIMTNLLNPCSPHLDGTLENPFMNNPSFVTTWSNFIAFRNHEDGVLVEDVGNMIFDKFYLLDNKYSGFKILETSRTDEETVLINSIIVGKSIGNAATDGELLSSYGLYTPTTDRFRVQNVHFENFSSPMTLIKSISKEKFVTSGKLTRFIGISKANVSSNMVLWENSRREVYEDMDGSLTGRMVHCWVSSTGIHISGEAECTTSVAESKLWDNGLICTKQLVRVKFTHPEYSGGLSAQAIFSQLADSNGVILGGFDSTKYYISNVSGVLFTEMKEANGFIGVFLVGKMFSVQFELTMDISRIQIQLSPFHRGYSVADTIVLKFPYINYRETFELRKLAGINNSQFYKNVTSTLVDGQDPGALSTIKSLACAHGDWYNSIVESTMYLCLNQNGRTSGTINQLLDRADVKAIPCQVNCANPNAKCTQDGVTRLFSDPLSWKDQTVGKDIINPTGSKILNVPCTWTIIVDTDLITFDKIIVEGILRIDPTKSINISAFGIWIKGGTIVAEGATPGSPYTKHLNIKLLGDVKTKTQFVIDPYIEAGNKVIMNTGTFTLIGSPPTTTSTRLTQPLEIGSNLIRVESATDWVVGDLIAIAPTQLGLTQNEQFTITAIAGNVITLSSVSLYYHYGAPLLTLSETWGTYTQALDLRAQVLHLTRNIQIVGEIVADPFLQQGCRVLTYFFKQEADAAGNLLPPEQQLLNRGIVNWSGVEMSNCGQAATTRAAIEFSKSPSDDLKTMSFVTKSAIHNCPGYCANINSSSDITFDENNFYNGHSVLLRIWTVTNIVITNNHFVGALKRDLLFTPNGMGYEMNAHIYFYSEQNIIADKILVANNYMQGSEGICLVVPHTNCSDVSSFSATVGIYGNQAQTCLVGAMFQQTKSSCQWAGKVAVARSTKGFMINPTRLTIIIENVLATESNRSVILRFGNEGYNNSAIFKDSAIYGVAIDNDATAYDTKEKAAVCQNTSGTQNLVITRGGEKFPIKNSPLSFDVICSSEVFDAQLHQINVKYTRIKKVYLNAGLTNCSNNYMMATQHSASDATAGTYNTGVTCVDCDISAYFNFMSPSPSWNGWFGGCGLFLCTGPENVLNADQTGSLFGGIKTSAISHNAGIANSKCKLQPNWNNAYQCDGLDYVQIEWESNAPDFNKRSVAPVILTSSSGYTNTINMYREWVWNGNEPMNLRENRFVATALINTVYKIEYNGLNPYNLIHRLQPRTLNPIGEPTIWVIFNSIYQVPMNIEVSVVNEGIIDSFLLTDNIDLTTKTDICGANIYDWNTRSVQFVVNGSPNCIVRAVVLDTVRIHIKVNIKVSEFFANNNKISFISKVASFLGIKDYSRIKVVGSTPNPVRFLQSTSVPAPSSFNLVMDITNSSGNSQTPQQSYDVLDGYAANLTSGLASNSVPGIPPNVYNVLSSTTYVASDSNGGIYDNKTANDPSSSSSSSNSSTLILILGIVIGLVVISTIIVSFLAYKRRKQKQALFAQQKIENDLSNPQSNQSKVKPEFEPAAQNLQNNADISSAPLNIR